MSESLLLDARDRMTQLSQGHPTSVPASTMLGNDASQDPYPNSDLMNPLPHQQLYWPESEALLQSILSVDFGSWPTSSEALTLPFHANETRPQSSPANEASPWTSEAAADIGQGASYAVRDLTRIISNLVRDANDYNGNYYIG